MFPYILMIVVAFVGSYVALSSKDYRNERLKVGNILVGKNEYIKENNLAIGIFFLIFFFVLSLRDASIGRDVLNYQFYFNEYSKMKFLDAIKSEGDILYIALNWIVSRITDNFQIFLAIIAACTLIPIYKQYAKYKRHSFLKIILFMNMSVFIMFFSGLRQSVAIAMGMIAYECVKNKKFILFLLMVIIAIGFHHSAFILLLMYPAYHLKLKTRMLIFVIPFTVGILLFNKSIFNSIISIMDKLIAGKYDTEIVSTGAFTMIIMLLAFLVFTYIVGDEQTMDSETFGLRNLLIITLWLQCFAPIHTLTMRFNYYYIIFVPMLIPKIIDYSKKEYKNIVNWVELVIIIFFLIYYLEGVYSGCVTGYSALDTYPYIPFWSK